MRKILSIPLIILILFTGVTVNFATHYCAGSVAATKISLTGKLATCGMESPSDIKTNEGLYKNHCCDNVTAAYSLRADYIPSFAYDIDLCRQFNLITYVLVDSIIHHQIFIIDSDETTKPPGLYTPNSVDRQIICLFRI